MRTPRFRALPCAAALLVALAAIAGACGGGAKTATVTPTPAQAAGTPGASATPQPPATPTPASADAKAGEQLREAGDYSAAADVYGAIAAGSSGDKQQAARLAQAELLVRAARPADAKPLLEAYLAAGASDGDASVARYMLASALDDLGDMPGALDGYERYIAANGAAVDFARVERAKLLARLGRSADAETAGEAVLASGLLPEFKASFTLSIGAAFEQGGDDVSAKAWNTRAETIDGGDAGSALARIGGIDKRLGDPAWTDIYIQALTAYPGSASAPDLIDELDAASAPISDYVRGVVDYRASRNDDARAALTRAAAAGDNAAEATYYIGALDERADDPASAITSYENAYDIDPTSPLADDALWWRGRLLEDAKRFDEAGTVYATLIANFPSSTWRGDADFRRGLVQYKAGNYAGAALSWSVIGSSASGDDAYRARFWQGRALQAAKDPLAGAVLSQLVEDHDAKYSFYALRAEVLLGKNIVKESTPKLTNVSIDWGAIAKYTKGITGVDPQATVTPAQPDDARWDTGAALEDVDLHAQSDAVYRSLIRDNKDDVTALYRIAHRLADEGRTSLSARAAVTLIGALPETAATPPDDLLRVAYPAPYGDLVTAASSGEDISPLLLLALVRQESFFDADAGSGAGALGLTQVVPATGDQIAAKLGVTDFTGDDLYRPKISLQFGASYLKSQLDESNGDPYHALAAYNGGPGAASDAAEAAGSDDDLFVEELEFDETQQYVRIVTENLARYRQLYAKVDRPSLAQ
jgi:soluble lytic murein transglycosylase